MWFASNMACESMAMMADTMLNESMKMLMKPEKDLAYFLVLPYEVVTKVQSIVRKY